MATKDKEQEITKKVRLPRLPGKKDREQEVFCSLNGRNYIIKRGEEVEVPLALYEILMHSEKEAFKADEYETSRSGE